MCGGHLCRMTEYPTGQHFSPGDDAPAAADPGEQAPTPAAGAGEDVDPDIIIESDGSPDEQTDVTETVRTRPDPPFCTPALGSDD